MNKLIAAILGKMGYALVRKNSYSPAVFPDIKEKEFWSLFELCKPYTMTSVDRMYALYQAVQYVLDHKIEGDFVECGVWRGGSALLMAKMLSNRNITDRKVYLFDTFEGMSAPTDKDKSFDGKSADEQLQKGMHNKEKSVWCLADLNDVQNNLKHANLQDGQVVYVKGKVEDTLPAGMPAGKIALLRLDTDWYESTKHELEVLYPALTTNGVLIIDDYGHWEGCRKAVDEYLATHKIPLLLNRIDYTGRIAIKTEA